MKIIYNIKLSDNIYKSIKELKEFNYRHIYDFACSADELELVRLMFKTLFKRYLKDLNDNNIESSIIKSYLNNMDEDYRKNNSNERIVIDYIAGMTDDFLYKQYENNL